MDSVFEALRRFFETNGFDRTYWLAYSGGMDSHVLLHACSVLRQTYPLQCRAVYINHHLSPYASEWATHGERVCEALGIHFIQKNVHLTPGDQSPEEAARNARYLALAEGMHAGDFLLTAHHQDDQAETVLLQLLRGSGLKGLSAMPLVKPFAQGFHARPLLSLSRAGLKKYADQQKLHWIDDESNADPHFTRNFLRLDVLPLLRQRWPSVTKTLARVADHCAEAQVLLENMVIDDLNLINKDGMAISKLLQLSPEKQRHVLRQWFHVLAFPAPSQAKMQQIQSSFLSADQDKSPHLQWGGVELRRFQDTLYAMKCLKEPDLTKTYSWDLREALSIPQSGTLQVTRLQGGGIRANIPHLEVKFRQGGERCQLPGRAGRHELKKLFQQWQVPPWERVRMPLLYWDDQLVVVPGFYIHDNVAAKQDEEGLNIYYTKS